MELDYPKNVNKKNVEQPVSLDIGTVAPAEFRITVRMFCQAQNSTEKADVAPESSAESQVTTYESGRRVQLQLKKGHETPEDAMELLQHPVFAAPPEATEATESGDAVEVPAGVSCLCARTSAGECSFHGFQIGGEGLEALEAGPYTLVISSADLADQRILVQLSIPKGKKK